MISRNSGVRTMYKHNQEVYIHTRYMQARFNFSRVFVKKKTKQKVLDKIRNIDHIVNVCVRVT